MRARRGPWLATALIMLVAASATALSTYLHWLPCRGAMLNGSVLTGFRFPVDFTDACLHRMDTGIPFPYPDMSNQSAWAPELGVLATVLLALGWAVLVLSRRLSVRTTVVAVLPALVLLGMAGCAVMAIRGFHRPLLDDAWLWVLLGIDVASAAAVVAMGKQLWDEGHGYTVVQVLVAAGGLGAFGAVQQAAAYVLMVAFSNADWDTPPGTGYLSAAVITLSALATAVLAVRAPSPVEEDTGVAVRAA